MSACLTPQLVISVAIGIGICLLCVAFIVVAWRN